MRTYLDIVKKILDEGKLEETRTGIKAYTIAGAIFEHDMSKGFPLLTTKKTPFKLVASELEFFINGITDKKWLQNKNNHIWDEWAKPQLAPYGHDEESKKKMLEERDLGPIYGFQWRHFNAPYNKFDSDYTDKGIDQLKKVVETLKTNPRDRRMIVSAWNPLQFNEMALPPCHYSFQVTVIDGKLNLLWNQRSVDTMLGLPFNIASDAILLHLLAKESGLKERVDSSRVFRQENYRGKISEVILINPKDGQLTLEKALEYASADGYTPMNLRIVNKVKREDGNPINNEPAEVIELEDRGEYCALIVKNGDLYDLYLSGQYKFIA